VLPPDHRLAGRDVVDWDDLESLDFVDFSTAWVAREVVDTTFSARRRSRHTTMTVDDVHMLLDLVSHGLGAAILPESIASKPQAADLALAAIAAPELAWQVHLALSGQAGSAARAFAAMLIPAVTTDDIREQILQSAAVPG
jgi:DNA-binding transcriptional LysR family regulator